jgi:hypothetical protein
MRRQRLREKGSIFTLLQICVIPRLPFNPAPEHSGQEINCERSEKRESRRKFSLKNVLENSLLILQLKCNECRPIFSVVACLFILPVKGMVAKGFESILHLYF